MPQAVMSFNKQQLSELGMLVVSYCLSLREAQLHARWTDVQSIPIIWHGCSI